jgi:N-dimethylarginine dimethylaminohydrolase
MKSYYVKLIDPKANAILEGLVNLNMIKIQEVESSNLFFEFLNKIRKKPASLKSVDKIKNEVDA